MYFLSCLDRNTGPQPRQQRWRNMFRFRQSHSKVFLPVVAWLERLERIVVIVFQFATDDGFKIVVIQIHGYVLWMVCKDDLVPSRLNHDTFDVPADEVAEVGPESVILQSS